LKRKDGTPFKVESVYNCYAALAHYLREHNAIGSRVCLWDKYYFPKALKCLDRKMRLLQMDGYGDTNSSDALTSDEITACLNYNYLSVTNNEGLTRQIFFWLSLLCSLRGGDTKKNNQGGVFQCRRYGHTATHTVSIPPNNNENQFAPIKDIILYLSKHPAKCQDSDPLFLECYKPSCMGANKLKKMLHQIAVNTTSDTSEDELMAFSNHRSCEGIMSYIKPTYDQQLNSIASLIPFATIEEDLEEYYNYLGESYITYESEEDNSDTEMTISNSDSRILECEISETFIMASSESEIEVTATSNNSIINNSLQHKLPKTRKIIKQSKSRLTVFTPFKPPIKKAKISNSKSNLQQKQFYNTQKNQLYNTQEK
ncbi:1408_t:CDS:2, partial [Cetraspora pellucida]